ncbi:GAF domain-containing protein [Mitsuaria sp. 7]|uniref:GAF domain-containing protein n=1 Tax=Mitsuaria sp. 7 TaxID=1658665 RepID=UPI0007DDF3E1|nr:GAF domain-containing protein [Mitsuaria sp. 7]ANH68156.1 hypothetical protein ABE85_12295 [Mitsuaria sp. 7]
MPTHCLADSERLYGRWQRMLEVLAQQLDMPVAMINLVDGSDLVFFGVRDEQQRFPRNGRLELAVNSYCANVIRRGEHLLVGDVRRLPAISDRNPTAALGLVHYYGEPIRDAEGTVVGTVCVMDERPRETSSGVRMLVTLMRDAIEDDLRACTEVERSEARHAELKSSARRLLDAMARSGLGEARALEALGFSADDLENHQRLAQLAQPVQSGQAGQAV